MQRIYLNVFLNVRIFYSSVVFRCDLCMRATPRKVKWNVVTRSRDPFGNGMFCSVSKQMVDFTSTFNPTCLFIGIN